MRFAPLCVLWLLAAGGAAEAAPQRAFRRLGPHDGLPLIDPVEHVLKVVPLDGDSYARLSWEKTAARVIEVDGASRRRHALVPGRPIDLVRRGKRLWVSTDRHLASLHSSGEPEVMGPSDGLPSGGPLLVDREGSLWLGWVRPPPRRCG